MVTGLIIAGIIVIFIVGFILVSKRHTNILNKIDFAREYRKTFVDFANKYFENYERWSNSGNFDGELYVWLTMNVSKIQSNLGSFGIMDYIAPFQAYKVSNYQIVTNTIPKFRDGQIKDFDVNSVDDCLLRYLGYLEEYSLDTLSDFKNPIIWFREGFKEIIGIPLFIFSSFGIFSRRTVDNIMGSLIFKIVTGIIALVTLVSGLVTIIIGYDQTVQFISSLLRKQ